MKMTRYFHMIITRYFHMLHDCTQIFTELIRAYIDALEPSSSTATQQPQGLLSGLLRLLGALMLPVGGN